MIGIRVCIAPPLDWLLSMIALPWANTLRLWQVKRLEVSLQAFLVSDKTIHSLIHPLRNIRIQARAPPVGPRKKIDRIRDHCLHPPLTNQLLPCLCAPASRPMAAAPRPLSYEMRRC
jgi:hypothetical protein